MSYSHFLSDFVLNENDDIAVEFQEVYENFYENVSDNNSTDSESEGSSICESDDSINSSDSSLSDQLEIANEPRDFTELQFAHVTDNVRNFMTEKCKCKIYRNRFSCCYQFEPQVINDMRDSCSLRDSWERGINLLNELVLGALNSNIMIVKMK